MHPCNASYSEGRHRRMTEFEASPPEVSKTLSQNKNKNKRTRHSILKALVSLFTVYFSRVILGLTC
jgi:hypothetical protein